MAICTLETVITVFRIGNRQLVGGCRFGLVFLNRQLNRQLQSESATVAKIWLPAFKARHDNLSFRIGNRQLVAGCRFELVLLNQQLQSESATVFKTWLLLFLKQSSGLVRFGTLCINGYLHPRNNNNCVSNRQPATSCRLPIRTCVFESATESATGI